MQVTFTNLSSAPIYVPSLWISLAAGAAVTTRRTVEDMNRDQALKQMVVSNTLGLAFVKELGDDANLGPNLGLASYTNITRPNPALVPMFSMIYNTDDNAPNWSDTVNWRDADGDIT